MRTGTVEVGLIVAVGALGRSRGELLMGGGEAGGACCAGLGGDERDAAKREKARAQELR